jgi:hypothetical protein
MVTRTRLNVTLYVQCLSWLNKAYCLCTCNFSLLKRLYFVVLCISHCVVLCILILLFCVDWGSRSRGYQPVAPRPLTYGPFVHRPTSPEAIHIKRHERHLLVKDGIGREMAGFRLPRKSQGSFTCHKSATWDRRLYFPFEKRHAVDFFARKIRRVRPGSVYCFV